MLVEFNVLFDVPDLLHVLKVPTKFLPTSIPFSKSKGGPQLFIKKLVDWSVAVDSSTRIAVLE